MAEPAPDPSRPPDTANGPLAGRTVAVTAERRRQDQADLLRKRGATVVLASTMHTVDLSADDTLQRRTREIIRHPPTWTVATTGFGMRLWFEAADAWGLGHELVEALAASQVVARGPKARSACRQRGLEVVWQAPGESMPEVVEWLRHRDGIGASSVAVQLFDPADHPSTAALEEIAGSVVPVAVYRWRLPDELGPVHELVQRVVDRRVDAVTFTSQPAVRFLLQVAREEGCADQLVEACNDGSVLPVCIGPVCAEPAEEAGITTAAWPEPYRLVPMVKLVEERLGRR